MDLEKLKKWFLSQARDLPWRNGRDPYAVWVSEVMLQQTQVAVVIPYFEKWMARFPTVEALAFASQQEVLKVWEGLGYYSRARNLHQGAQQVVKTFGGRIPSEPQQLAKIKGIGPYTLGAILSFAFKKKCPAVDGNVKRVLARHFLVELDFSSPAAAKKIWQLQYDLLPDQEPWIVCEALIELGACVCTKKPLCNICPIRTSCKAFQNGKQEKIPFSSKKEKITPLSRFVAVVRSGGHLLLRTGRAGEVMQDLFEFPWIEGWNGTGDPLEWARKEFSINPKSYKMLPEVRHSFTRFRVRLFPHLFELEKRQEVEGYKWFSSQEFSRAPFSSGHRRVLTNLLAS